MLQDKLIKWIGKRIEDLREERGISAREMSKRVVKEESYIRSIEVGRSKPSIIALADICDYMGISLKDFFDDEMEYPDMINRLIENAKRLNKRELETLVTLSELLAEKK